MTYAETIEYLFGLRLFGQKLGLETMRELLRLMGNPERSLRFLHIAGTNGKGSVAAMMQAVLTTAGIRTGLYTSPHLVSFCERFQVDGRMITEADVVRLVKQLRPLLNKVDRHPTFFETVTALALQYFNEQRVDAVVWETGLGGRLDATNVVTPLVSVITNIAFDHMQYLGETLSKIAAEKCGIIKPAIPVVTATEDPSALAVIRQHATACHSPLTIVGEQVKGIRWEETNAVQTVQLTGTRRDYGRLEIPLLGSHQVANCATAVAALEAAGFEINSDLVRCGLQQTKWPGRFQILDADPPLVLDGAHNAAAAERLAATLREHFRGRRLTLIFGVLRDKNFDQMCRILAPLAGRILCVPVNSERTSDPAHLVELCRTAHPQAAVDSSPNVREALAVAQRERDHVVVITGSLFLVGEALATRCGTLNPRELRLQ